MANEKLMTRETAKEVVSGYTQKLENGQIIPSKSLVAKELETVSPESGDTQETPFALQGTGTANGTSSVDTGTVGKHIQKQGSVYCVNQQFVNGNFPSATTDWYNPQNATWSVSNNTGKLTLTSNTPDSVSITKANVSYNKCIPGHIYFVLGKMKASYAGATVTFGAFGYRGNLQVGTITSANTWYQFSRVYSGITTTWNFLAITLNNNTNAVIGDTVELKEFEIIDLTQWFNGNIPQDLLDHPEHWSWYQTYGDYIAYNTGTLVSGNGKWLVCGGRNLLNLDRTAGTLSGWGQGNKRAFDETKYYMNLSRENYYDTSYSTLDSYSNGSFTITCSGGYGLGLPIKVISGKEYILRYDKSGTGNDEWSISWYKQDGTYISNIGGKNTSGATGTAPENAYWGVVIFRPNGQLTYSNITFSLYYAGEDYSQYYSYEQPKVYDTGDEELLSTGVKLSVSGEREDIYDYKEPSGLITRRVGKVNLGTLDYVYDVTRFYTTGLVSLIKIDEGTLNLVSSLFIATSTLSEVTSGNGKMRLSSNGAISFSTQGYTDKDTFKSAMNGVYLYYELATPITEQGTPFSENIEINDFGTMGWYATYTNANTNTLVSVPQGCKIFYPAWYVGFIDTLGQRDDIDWNANNVVSHSELSAYDVINAQLKDAIGGTLRQILCDRATLDFSKTAWVDLGSLTWTYNSNGYFNATISDMITSSTNNVVCSKYGTLDYNTPFGTYDKVIKCLGYSILSLKDTSAGTDATQFKNAMKGVLLAYEKA